MVHTFAIPENSLEYLHDHPVYAIALRDAGGQTEDLLEVVPPPEVIRPGELPLRLPESEVRLLLDPVLNPGLVPGDGLELEHEEHSHGYDNPQGEPQTKQGSEQGPEGEDDLEQCFHELFKLFNYSVFIFVHYRRS